MWVLWCFLGLACSLPLDWAKEKDRVRNSNLPPSGNIMWLKVITQTFHRLTGAAGLGLLVNMKVLFPGRCLQNLAWLRVSFK